MKLAVVVGTSRIGSMTSKVAEYVSGVLREKDVEVEIVSIQDHVPEPITARVGKEMGDVPSKWQDVVKSVDGLVVTIPEYNRSYPGELKLLWDQLYPEYKGKPVYCVGVSDGMTGGARAIDAFNLVILGVEAVPFKPKVFFPNVPEMFDGDSLKEEYKEKYEERIQGIIDLLEGFLGEKLN
jgi:NAD(P)H-dependent FMN reductase